ncbi:hypothetical protein Tco_0335824 [Tanacetum coccineum]
MSAITDIKCVLSQKTFDAFCEKFHIPKEVHHVLPNQGDTMHESPAGKIGLYTKFFDFANFRLPLSTFLVNTLRHFCINISQLSVIRAAKNGWMSFRIAPAAADFNAHDYATLVAHPSPFWKFLEEFLCLVGLSRHYTLDEETYPQFLDKDGEDMDIFAFIHTLDPAKVKVVERERIKDEPRLLETTVGLTVPLLPVAPDHAESELEASVDKLFDKGSSGNQAGQGDSAGVRDGANIQPVTEATDAVAEDVASLGLTVQRLLAGAVLNAEVRGKPIPTFPFVTSSVSATLGHEVGDHTDPVSEPNFCTIGASQRFVISSDSSHHFGTNVAEAKVDSLIRSSAPVMMTVTIVTPTVDTAATAKEKPVKPSLFSVASSLAGGTDPTPGSFSDLTGSDFIVGGTHIIISPDTDLQKVYFFASIHGMEHDQLFIEFKIGAARQMSLSAEVRMYAEYNIREKRRLKSVAEKRAEILKVREKEVEDLKEQLLLKEAEAMEAIRLCVEASKFEARDALDVKFMGLKALDMGKDRELTDLNAQLTFVKSYNDSLIDQVHELEDAQLKIVSDNFDKLYADFVEMALHLEEKFYPYLLTTIFGHRWLITHDMKLAIIKCLNSPEYLSALEAAIGKAIEKGMQDRLAAGITHGKEGRKLTDVAAHNPFAEVDYVFALQQLQDVNFSLLADLKSNKDASVETVMNILRLEDPLAEKLGLSELQPHVDQLMVPIHRSPDQVVLGASALSLALDPLSVTALTGTEGTSNVILATADTTTALSVTFASANIITPISVDDYEVVGTDDKVDADGNVEPFPNVDDVELNIPYAAVMYDLFGRVRGSCLSSRPLNLYAPFPSASVTSYGASHLGPRFLVSSAQLASLLRYTRSTSALLSVGMPISVGMTASVPYGNENEVSPLLDFIMAIGLRMFNRSKVLADT